MRIAWERDVNFYCKIYTRKLKKSHKINIQTKYFGKQDVLFYISWQLNINP